MKPTIIFLSIFVAVSQQYYLPRAFPWLPAFVQQPAYYNEYLLDSYYNNLDDYSARQQISPTIVSPFFASNQEEDENDFSNVQARIKGYGSKQRLSNQLQNARLYLTLNANSTVTNPLLKTVTFTLTSTCTSYSIVTCIPRDNVLGPAAVVQCRRKRQIDSVELNGDSNSQFPIIATQPQPVEPTTIQQPRSMSDSRQTPFDVVSSKEDEPDDEPNETLTRNRRFYRLWQSFATGTTITTWVVISSTTTLKSIPLDNVGALAVLACLPVGVSLC